MKRLIAIDGPSSSGKSTTARLVAKELSYIYIDTGAMYRAVTVAWLRACNQNNSIYPANDTSTLTIPNENFDENFVLNLLNSLNIELKQSDEGQQTFLNGENVSREIREPIVTKYVSPISAMQNVRDYLVSQQRELGQNGGVVMDGRDIGTVVFPDADLKIFLIASAEERAKRRTLELLAQGKKVTQEEVKQQLIARDNYDSTRAASPLKKADDAIEIDNSLLTIPEQVEKILNLAKM